MAPCLVIETSRFVLSAEYSFGEIPFLEDEKHKPQTILRITVVRKGVLRQIRETFIKSNSNSNYGEVIEAGGRLYGHVPDPLEYHDSKGDCRSMDIRLYQLKVHLVAKSPDNLILTAPYLKLNMENPQGNFRVSGHRGRRLI